MAENAMVKQFFGALYQDPAPGAFGTLGDDQQFDQLVNRITASKDGFRASGDAALQNLMFNYILSRPEHVEQGKQLSAVLGNIQRLAVGAFSERFPTATLEGLMEAAKAEGYDVEVLKAV